MKVSQEQSSGITRTVDDIDPGDVYDFLSLPAMEIRSIPYDKCKTGLKNKLMDLIEILPDDVHAVCSAQYRKAKNI